MKRYQEKISSDHQLKFSKGFQNIKSTFLGKKKVDSVFIEIIVT